MQNNSTRFKKGLAAVIGLALLAPAILISTLVTILSSQLSSNRSSDTSSQTAPQEYAKSFYVIIREKEQNIHIWAQDLAGKANFRQIIEADGKVISQQLYLADEKTLYVSQQGSGQTTQWEKTGNLEPKDIGIPNITSGPAVWALQNGIGDSEVKLRQGTLNITVKSVDQPIDKEIFQPTGNINLQ